MKDLNELEQSIGYHFQDRQLLIQALTHSSYLNECRGNREQQTDNERLEFFGDAIIEFIVSDYLYQNRSDTPEGDMTKLRASMVCEPSLAFCSETIHLGDYLFMGRGEEASGGRKRASITSDAFEALTASIYLDGGQEAARNFIRVHLLDTLKPSMLFFDTKTRLQEIVQKSGNARLSYELLSEEGPSHNKQFVTAVYLDGKEIGRGTGHSKKASQQAAAGNAIQALEQQTYTGGSAQT